MITFTCKTKKEVSYRRAFLRCTIHGVVEEPETKEVFLLLNQKRGLFRRKREWILVKGTFEEVVQALQRKTLAV